MQYATLYRTDLYIHILKRVFSDKDTINIKRDASDITLSSKFNVHINW